MLPDDLKAQISTNIYHLGDFLKIIINLYLSYKNNLDLFDINF